VRRSVKAATVLPQATVIPVRPTPPGRTDAVHATSTGQGITARPTTVLVINAVPPVSDRHPENVFSVRHTVSGILAMSASARTTGVGRTAQITWVPVTTAAPVGATVHRGPIVTPAYRTRTETNSDTAHASKDGKEQAAPAILASVTRAVALAMVLRTLSVFHVLEMQVLSEMRVSATQTGMGRLAATGARAARRFVICVPVQLPEIAFAALQERAGTFKVSVSVSTVSGREQAAPPTTAQNASITRSVMRQVLAYVMGFGTVSRAVTGLDSVIRDALHVLDP
jgi:hypothetical protein